MTAPRETRVLFAFADPAGDAPWRTVNDDVMGGVSRAAFELRRPGCALFHGQLSRRFGGGFATVRSPARDLGLGGWDGVRLRLRGDGRVYRFGALEDDAVGTFGVWRTEVRTRAGDWIDVHVPFASLVLTHRGREIDRRRPPPLDRMRSLTFGIADRDEAPFRLEIGPIVAFRDRR